VNNWTGRHRPDEHLPNVTDIQAQVAAAPESTVRSAATGDEIAFARLVHEHHASMARVAYVICGDAESTRDAVQVAWTKAWRQMGVLRDHGQVRAWLVAIAANEARQVVRRRRRERVIDISGEVRRAETGDPVEALDLVDLERALADLHPDDRSLLAMRYAAGLDSIQIAPHVGLSASGVRSRLARILERLRVSLAVPAETSDD
jgi:RNA polymerase sigma factor (sigma-70 family)